MTVPTPVFLRQRAKGRYTREQRAVDMEYNCADEDKVYQFKLMQAITLPAYPQHSGAMKQWSEKNLNAVYKLDQSGKHIHQKWIKVALYPGTDADVLLK